MYRECYDIIIVVYIIIYMIVKRPNIDHQKHTILSLLHMNYVYKLDPLSEWTIEDYYIFIIIIFVLLF